MLYFFSVLGIAREGIKPCLADGLTGVLILSHLFSPPLPIRGRLQGRPLERAIYSRKNY
jgi:hypothetical protein